MTPVAPLHHQPQLHRDDRLVTRQRRRGAKVRLDVAGLVGEHPQEAVDSLTGQRVDPVARSCFAVSLLRVAGRAVVVTRR
jgi:hypothetical protein